MEGGLAGHPIHLATGQVPQIKYWANNLASGYKAVKCILKQLWTTSELAGENVSHTQSRHGKQTLESGVTSFHAFPGGGT